MSSSEEIWRRAVVHVAALATGEPLAEGRTVTLHFHPDRLTRSGEPILDAMRRDNRYRSQFETGTGNGGLTAFPGGDRWRWESRLFGGVYDDAGPEHRPVYGALDHSGRPIGGSPRFGSSHFRLAAHALDRTTFCFPDSVLEPTRFGVRARMPVTDPPESGDPLDDYVEAHVHGPVLLDRDVAALVLDPSYRGTEVEAAARALPCPVEWHPGFRVSAAELRRHPGYRPDAGREFAERLAGHGLLVPRLVGDAARAVGSDPQLVKWAWHYLARFGG
ncbi:hypothetical protein J2S43_003867 [Catenuloplanes nepalensis]|uniref:DUF3626 domain-containing protein n=1 Tax=Catenuloplanes nepalensis TaxID=587533 RepID=A0ABT9MV97_9ACTN|nr:DUF3626 domain-containing protein [Catenuloplanes nepalensis]MDP9795355.1 hypothetical protein [Catenuloplanes nepalensis]